MIKVGDTVMIRGDLDGRYLPEQLIDGKYVKHAFENRPWTGVVQKINPGVGDGPMALVGGGWRGIERYEVVKNA